MLIDLMITRETISISGNKDSKLISYIDKNSHTDIFQKFHQIYVSNVSTTVIYQLLTAALKSVFWCDITENREIISRY